MRMLTFLFWTLIGMGGLPFFVVVLSAVHIGGIAGRMLGRTITYAFVAKNT